jgi:hypothetical protein
MAQQSDGKLRPIQGIWSILGIYGYGEPTAQFAVIKEEP